MNHLHLVTSIGTVLFTWNSRGLITRVDWLPYRGLSTDSFVEPNIAGWESIKSYFATGHPIQLSEEALDGTLWTEFEKKVYLAVLQIPHGETRTYSWVAQKIGQRHATRAVGQALRRNRHLILIPCHRVVSAQDLGGYLGTVDPLAPEVQFKRQLLAWENSWRNPSFEFLTA